MIDSVIKICILSTQCSKMRYRHLVCIEIGMEFYENCAKVLVSEFVECCTTYTRLSHLIWYYDKVSKCNYELFV